MSDTSCDRLITVRDYITEYYNMYIYEGAFGRINPYIKYGKRHPKPVINPGNLMADISFRCSQGFIFMFRGYLSSLAVTCDRSVFPGYSSFLH